MNFRETILKDAYIIDLEPFKDKRGFFARTFCQKEFEAIGHEKDFVQINHSHTVQKGTIRGMHYQIAPHAEIKLIRCIRGGVYDVIVDMRPHSSTYLQHIGVALTAENQRMIYVPKGFAHGFQTLEDATELIYHHTAFYAPEFERGIRYDDPVIGIDWPMEVTVVSEKDQKHLFLNSTKIELLI